MNRLRINLTLAFPVAVFASAFEVGILVDPSSGWTWSDALWLWLSEGAMFLVFLSVALESFIRIGWVSPIRLQSMVGRAKMFAWLGVAICLGTIGFVLREVPRAEGVALGTDVLLITLDTTRADALSVYGNTAVKTPALDALAAQGVRYERAFATAPQTGPSHLSILTGLHPFETGVYSNATEVGNVEMIAGKFQEEGWSTAAFVSGYPLHSRFGFDQGFNVYDALFGGAVGLLNRAFNKVIFGGGDRERRGDRTVSRALDWIEGVEGPMFSWVHLYDPHGPYRAPRSFRGTITALDKGSKLEREQLPVFWPASERRLRYSGELVASYLEEVAWMDAQIGELLDGYKAARPNSVPLIIVVADHGESFLEHGIIFDHGDDLYDPTMRVPLIVSGGGFPRDVVSDCLVSTVDIFPTVLGVVGLSKEDGVGRSLKKALAIAGECPERKIYGSTVGSRALNPPIHHMVRGSTDKFLQLTETDERYFDLTRDPQELSPISDTRMGRLRLLKKYLSMKLDNQVNAKERQDEAEVLKGLQQLGYVDQP